MKDTKTITINAPELLEAKFNKFIEKRCVDDAPHLLDTDEQDGQFFRDEIQYLMAINALQAVLKATYRISAESDNLAVHKERAKALQGISELEYHHEERI